MSVIRKLVSTNQALRALKNGDVSYPDKANTNFQNHHNVKSPENILENIYFTLPSLNQ